MKNGELRANGFDLAVTGWRGDYTVFDYGTRDADGRPRFVARFKHGNAMRSLETFCRFLVNHLTPAEYYRLYDLNVAPVTILESRGFIPYNVARAGRMGCADFVPFTPAERRERALREVAAANRRAEESYENRVQAYMLANRCTRAVAETALAA